MIGNDVIDIALAQQESNWQRAGFLQKIFTTAEQLLITECQNPEIAVWILWSRKEAAYKIVARQSGIRRFIPLQLECANLELESSVNYKGAEYFTRTKITSASIYTTAATIAVDFNFIQELPIDSEITKIGILPFITQNGLLCPVSITHHGRFHHIAVLRAI